MNCKIRRATLDDLAALAALFDAYRRFYGQPPDLAGARSFLEERLAQDESVVFLATRGEAPAGFTQLYPLFTSVGMRRLWLLNDLYVAADARREGVATGLLQAAHAHAAATGATGVLLETQIANRGAAALYRGMGYVRNTATDYYFLELAPGD